MAIIYKVTGYVVHRAKMECDIADYIADVLRYKLGMITHYFNAERRDIGEWSDDNPLNYIDCKLEDCEKWFTSDNIKKDIIGLKPCPFCGSKMNAAIVMEKEWYPLSNEIEQNEYDELKNIIKDDDNKYGFCCINCGVMSKEFNTIDEAITACNQRAGEIKYHEYD